MSGYALAGISTSPLVRGSTEPPESAIGVVWSRFIFCKNRITTPGVRTNNPIMIGY